MAFPFNVADYVQPPKMDVAHAIAVTAKLLRRVPAGAPASVKAAVAQLRKRVATLRAAWMKRTAKKPAPSAKPQVAALIAAWTALQTSLTAWTQLPLGESAEQAEAQAQLDAIFPRGRLFLTLERGALWAESERRLEPLDAEGHASKIDALVGGTFLRTLREAHRACGDALGCTATPAPAEASVDLASLLNAVRDAISAYALQLLASTDAEDASSIARTAHALSPIDEQRGRTGARGATNTADAPVNTTSTKGAVTPPAPDALPANDNLAPVTRARPKTRRVA